ncbi:hypothetical protein GCM10027447_27870 [Glycomyces halotolerans]
MTVSPRRARPKFPTSGRATPHPYDTTQDMTPTQILVLSLGLIALWLAAVAYSRHRWPYLGCRACGGTGKKFEWIVFTWACFRLRRAWRACDTCHGSARRERPRGLALPRLFSK